MTKNKTCNLKNDFDINNMEIDLQSEVMISNAREAFYNRF
jgi:hypothetical protein